MHITIALPTQNPPSIYSLLWTLRWVYCSQCRICVCVCVCVCACPCVRVKIQGPGHLPPSSCSRDGTWQKKLWGVFSFLEWDYL